MIGRRTALFAIPAAGLVVSSKVVACSPALIGPEQAGKQEKTARSLFRAWFSRERDKYVSFFRNWKSDDGESLKGLVEPDASDVENAIALFDRFFVDEKLFGNVATVLNFGGDLIIDCHERNASGIIEPDCSGMPQGHLFMLEMFGANPKKLSFLKSRGIPQSGYVSGINFNG